MPRITEYTKATSFDANDVLLKDGTNGTKKIEIEDFIADVSDTTSTTNGKLAKAGDVAELKDQTTLPEEALAWLTYETDMYVRSSDGKTISSNSGLAATAYVDVSGYQKIKYRRVKTTAASPAHGMAFYTSGLAPIPGVGSLSGQASNGYADELYEVDVPATAKYARFTYQGDISTYGEFSVVGSEKISSRMGEVSNELHELSEPTSLYSASSVNWFSGYIRATNGSVASSDVFEHTVYIDLTGIKRLRYTKYASTSSAGNAGMAFYDENFSYLAGEMAYPSQDEAGYIMTTLAVPDGAKYARFAKNLTLEGQGKYFELYDLDSIPAKVDEIENEIKMPFENLTWHIDGSGYIRWESGGPSSSETLNRTGYVYIGDCKTIKYRRPKSTNASSAAGMAFYTKRNVTNGYFGGIQNAYDAVNSGYEWNTVNVPEGANFAKFSILKDTDTYGEFEIYGQKKINAYVDDLKNQLTPIIGSPVIHLFENDPVWAEFDGRPVASGGTPYTAVYDLYDALCLAYPRWIKRDSNIGNDSEGNPIAHYTLRMYDPIVSNGAEYSDWDGTDPAPANYYEINTEYRRIFLSAGVHGIEKCGVLALYFLTKEMLSSNEDWARFVRSNFVIEIVPIICPGNFNANRRENINGINVNRDYLAKESAEAQVITTYIDSIASEICCSIDFHMTSGSMCFIAVPPINPKLNQIMTLANQTLALCADNWDEARELFDIGDEFYPYGYANISANTGTSPYYMTYMGITDNAVTLEIPKSANMGTDGYSQKYVKLSKMGMDIGVNIMQRLAVG